MPRDRMGDERPHRHGRWDDPRDVRDPRRREDFGQDDVSSGYGYGPDRREGYRADEDLGQEREDYGQADYSTDYAFDPDTGEAYRRYAADDRDGGRDEGRGPGPGAYRAERDYGPGERDRSWADRWRPIFGGRAAQERRRRGPSDRVLWAVIVERLEDVRGLDLRDVEVLVENAEVTLNGAVRRKEDKRRIEDVADLDGVRHVQNNLRVREGGFRRWF